MSIGNCGLGDRFVRVCTAEVTDDVATALVETIQKLDRGSKQHYTRLLLRDAGELEWPRDLLGQITDAALYHPEKTVRHVIFPLVCEACLSQSAAERVAQRPRGFRLWQEVLYRKSVRHYRRMLPIILEHLSFRSDERSDRSWRPSRAFNRPSTAGPNILPSPFRSREAFLEIGRTA